MNAEIPADDPTRGPWVIARQNINARGFPEYEFRVIPFVHRTLHGADSEARRLAKELDSEVAVFKKCYTIVPETVEIKSLAVDADKLAAAMARLVQERNFFMPVDVARMLVEKALKEVSS